MPGSGVGDDVEPRRREHRVRLRRESAAAKEAAQCVTCRRETLHLAPCHRAGIEVGGDRASGGTLHRVLQRRSQGWLAGRRFNVAGTEHDRGAWLSRRRQPLEDEARGSWSGWFGDKDEVIGPVVRCKEIDGIEGAEAADRIAEIASAHPDSVRDSGAGTCQQHRDLLQSGPRGGDYPDPAARYDIGERERRPGNVGSAAVGSHHQQSASAGALLERALGLQRDVVAEQHHVQTAIEGTPCLAGRVDAGRRDQRQVRILHAVEGPVEGSGPPPSLFGARAAGAPQRACGMRQRSLGRGLAGRPNRDDEIVRSRRITGWGEQTGLSHHVQVRRRAGHRHRVLDTPQRGELRRETHQRDRVEVEPAPNLVDYHVCSSCVRPFESCRIMYSVRPTEPLRADELSPPNRRLHSSAAHSIVPLILDDPKLAQDFADRRRETGVPVAEFSFPVVPAERTGFEPGCPQRTISRIRIARSPPSRRSGATSTSSVSAMGRGT